MPLPIHSHQSVTYCAPLGNSKHRAVWLWHTLTIMNQTDRPQSGKRMLFSKPSWSKSENLSNGDLFHRSNQIYIASTAQIGSTLKRGQASQRAESTVKREDVEHITKRQRNVEDEADEDDEHDHKDFNDDAEDDDDDDSITLREQTTIGGCDQGPSTGADNVKHAVSDSKDSGARWKGFDDQVSPPSLRKTPDLSDNVLHKESTLLLKRAEIDCSTIPEVIDLDREDTPPKALNPSITSMDISKMTASSETDDFAASDDEFPELKKKARERAEKQLDKDKDLPASTSYIAENKNQYSQSSLHGVSSLSDPIVQILITSSIPNTTPLIVFRKLSQRLKDVRLAWTDRQRLSGDTSQHVFLTWRGKRLFDVTTCKSLGIAVDTKGRILAKDDVLGDEEGRIHMEAMTHDILDHRRRAKTEAAAKSENGIRALDTQKQAQQRDENQIRIILKAKGFEDLKLKVKAVRPPDFVLSTNLSTYLS